MSNGLSALLKLKQMADAKKTSAVAASSESTVSPTPEPAAGIAGTIGVPAVSGSLSTELKPEHPDTGAQMPEITNPEPSLPAPQEAPIAAGVENRPPASTPAAPAIPSLETIARMDEAGLPASDLSAQIKADFDRLDLLIQQSNGINAFNLDDCRGIIMRTMPELKKNPMYDGLVLDRDVHNIMMFCVATQQAATIANVVKADKETKSKGRNATKNALANAMANMTLSLGDDGGLEL